MKRFKYWKLNAGQDTDEASKSPALFFQEDPDHESNNKPAQGPPSMRVLPSIGQALGGDLKENVPGVKDEQGRPFIKRQNVSGIEEMA